MTYAVLSEDPNILFSSVNFPLSVDLSSNANLTSIAILSAQDLYKFYPQASDSVTVLTSLNSPTVIDLSTTASTASLLNITILQTTDLYQHAVQLGDPVLVSNKVYYSTDFVSITNFNVPEPVPLTFLERWAG